MIKSYKIKIYPNKEQKELIFLSFKATRFVYNYFLNVRIEKYKKEKEVYNFYKCCKDLTILKQKEDWLKKPDKYALQNALRDLELSYSYFFKRGYKGFPHFRTYKKHNSYRSSFCNNNITLENKILKIPKVGKLKTKGFENIEGNILNCTISFKNNNFYASITCNDVIIEEKEKTNDFVGIDLGLKTYIVTSDYFEYKNNYFIKKYSDKINNLNSILSKKKEKSKQFYKIKNKLNSVYQKLINSRNDYIHKITNELVSKYDIICIETLKPSKMKKNKNLQKYIYDASWNNFIEKLEYKCNWYGKTLVKVDQYFPSSQLCSVCGYKNPEVKNLKVREWRCPNCGINHDRDLNASKNILNEGLKLL